MNDTNNILVAVYGTLKKGQRLYDAYLPDKEPEGVMWLKDHTLFHLGAFPAAVPFAGHDVFCEVFKIDEPTLARLDNVEGVASGFYHRGTFDSPLGKVNFYYQEYEPFEESASKGKILHHIPNGIWLGQDTYKKMWLGTQLELASPTHMTPSRRLSIRYPDAKLDAHIWATLNKSTRFGMAEPQGTVVYLPPPEPTKPKYEVIDLAAVIGPGMEDAP